MPSLIRYKLKTHLKPLVIFYRFIDFRFSYGINQCGRSISLWESVHNCGVEANKKKYNENVISTRDIIK